MTVSWAQSVDFFLSGDPNSSIKTWIYISFFFISNWFAKPSSCFAWCDGFEPMELRKRNLLWLFNSWCEWHAFLRPGKKYLVSLDVKKHSVVCRLKGTDHQKKPPLITVQGWFIHYFRLVVMELFRLEAAASSFSLDFF